MKGGWQEKTEVDPDKGCTPYLNDGVTRGTSFSVVHLTFGTGNGFSSASR